MNSLRIKKRLNKKSPLSNNYKKFLRGKNVDQKLSPKKINIVKLNKKLSNKSNDSSEKRKNLLILIKKIPKQKLLSLIKNRIFGNSEKEKLYSLQQTPEKYFTFDELKKIIQKHKKQNTPGKHKKQNTPGKHKKQNTPEKSNRSKRRITRKLNKKHLHNRKISLNCKPKNNKNIDKIMNDIKKSNHKSLKKQLEKKGIHLKSNNKKLINDLYLFSSLGGITIKKN